MGKIKDMAEEYRRIGVTKEQVEGILELYRKGRAEEHIRRSFRVSQETLHRVIKYYGESNIEKTRETNINKWHELNFKNIMGLPQKEQSREENKGNKSKKLGTKEVIENLAKAIMDVEPKRPSGGEERE